MYCYHLHSFCYTYTNLLLFVYHFYLLFTLFLSTFLEILLAVNKQRAGGRSQVCSLRRRQSRTVVLMLLVMLLQVRGSNYRRPGRRRQTLKPLPTQIPPQTCPRCPAPSHHGDPSTWRCFWSLFFDTGCLKYSMKTQTSIPQKKETEKKVALERDPS